MQGTVNGEAPMTTHQRTTVVGSRELLRELLGKAALNVRFHRIPGFTGGLTEHKKQRLGWFLLIFLAAFCRLHYYQIGSFDHILVIESCLVT